MKNILTTVLFSFSGLLALHAQSRFVSDAAQNRNILLEEYTGIHCGNCPDGHKMAAELLTQYPQQVFIMNVHGTTLAKPTANEVDLRTPYGEDLILQAGAPAIPTGSLNRHIFSPNTTTALNRDFWKERAKDLLEMPSYVNIAAKATLDWQTRELSVTVQLYYTGTPPQQNFIHVAVLQDSITGYQNGSHLNPAQVTPDGQYLHMHVFRDFITGQWGQEVRTQGAGKLIEKTFTKTLPAKIGKVNLNLIDLQLIAFVSENKEEIINVCPVSVQDLNRPASIVHLSDPVQIAQNTCDKDVRFSVRINNHYLAAEPISRLIMESFGVTGKKRHSYTFDRPIQAGESVCVETDPISLAQANRNETVYLSIVSVNDGNFVNRQPQPLEGWAIKHYGITENPDISLDVQQDRFGADISWLLKTEKGDTVAKDGPYRNLSAKGTELHNYNLHISEACHTFTIYDKQRDGINNGSGEGFVRFSEKNNRIFAQNDGKYKDSAVIMLSLGKAEEVDPAQPDKPTLPEDPADTIPNRPADTLSIEHPDVRTLHIYPNPCKNIVHVSGLDAGEAVLHLRLFRLDGREALRIKGNINEINMERLPAGLYILELRTAQRTYRAKLQHR